MPSLLTAYEGAERVRSRTVTASVPLLDWLPGAKCCTTIPHLSVCRQGSPAGPPPCLHHPGRHNQRRGIAVESDRHRAEGDSRFRLSRPAQDSHVPHARLARHEKSRSALSRVPGPASDQL